MFRVWSYLVSNKVPKLGTIIELSNKRLCVIANSISLDELTLYTILPVSSAIFLAGDKDFIIIEDEGFKGKSVMLEIWNSMAVPIEFFKTTRFKGKLSDKYIQFLSSALYFLLQNRKNNSLMVLTGPPISSSSDIRLLFHQMETNAFQNLRKPLVSIQE